MPLDANKLAQAIAGAEAKAIPQRGIKPAAAVNGVFFDRDGKSYDCVIEEERELLSTHPLNDEQTKFETKTRIVADLRVNFATKNGDNWKPVPGVQRKGQAAFSEHKKQTYVRTAEDEAPPASPEAPAAAGPSTPSADSATVPVEPPAKPAKAPKAAKGKKAK